MTVLIPTGKMPEYLRTRVHTGMIYCWCLQGIRIDLDERTMLSVIRISGKFCGEYCGGKKRTTPQRLFVVPRCKTPQRGGLIDLGETCDPPNGSFFTTNPIEYEFF